MTFIMILILGILLLILAFILDRWDKNAQKRCSVRITAVVCGYMESTTTNDNDTTSTVYTPVYEFNYNGQIYKTYRNVYSQSQRYPYGHRVDIFINPDNPDDNYIPGSSGSMLRIGLIIGGVFIIIYAFSKL